MIAMMLAYVLMYLFEPSDIGTVPPSIRHIRVGDGYGGSNKTEFPPDGRMHRITLVKSPVPTSESLTRSLYARLATHYLRHFERNGVNRTEMLQPFLFNTSFCSACVWIQVKNGRVYVYDPRAVRYSMTAFRAQRLREALYFITSTVRRGMVGDLELVLSVMDAVASTHVGHNYRLPIPSSPMIPIFTPVTCNVSTNIPFPMMLTDVLRRAFPRKFGARRRGTLNEWDDVMSEFANNVSNKTPWQGKKRQAVFRGAVRLSASVPTVKEVDKSCSESGRTALWAVAHSTTFSCRQQARRFVNKVDVMTGGRLSKYLLKGFVENELDVELSGTCGGRIYTVKRLIPGQQMGYRIIVHAEGNSFWADRLLLMLFGTSVIMKQNVPCGMFFEPLLRPFIHFVPVDTKFRVARRMVHWTLDRDDEMKKMVDNGREFAATFLSLDAVQTFADEVLWRYANLSVIRHFDILPGAVQVYPRLE